MNLNVTAVGQVIDIKTGEEKNVLTFNDGELQIFITFPEFEKVMKLYASKIGSTKQEKPNKEFYVDPNAIKKASNGYIDPYAQYSDPTIVDESEQLEQSGQDEYYEDDEDGAVEL